MPGPEKELKEQDFIHEGIKDNPFPLFYWFCIILFVAICSAALTEWYSRVLTKEIQTSPFLQVTNRDFSLFLWQNPEFMRIHLSDKASYLPAFNYVETLSMNAEMADHHVVAPPEILFKYHTWHRLLSDEVPTQTVLKMDFPKFLEFAQEWSPTYWKEAPLEYVALIQNLSENTNSTLSLPLEVSQAYTGWKNFFFEGNAINSFQPTYELYAKLIVKYPHYARNYWQNLIPEYMQSPEEGIIIPRQDLPSFLKSTLYNFSLNE